MPSSVSGNPVESSGSTTPAADGSSAQSRPATTARPVRDARRVDERARRVRRRELRPHRRVVGQQARPGRGALVQPRSGRATASVAATPALVSPLLNRSTHIQAPGST